MFSEILDPGQAGQGGGEDEAAVEVRPGDRDDGNEPDRVRALTAGGQEGERQGEAGHRRQLGPEGNGRGADDERPERQPGRRPSADPGSPQADRRRMSPETSATIAARRIASPVQPAAP